MDDEKTRTHHRDKIQTAVWYGLKEQSVSAIADVACDQRKHEGAQHVAGGLACHVA